MNQDRAEVIGLQALGWLAGQEDLIGQFLNMSGSSSDELTTRASDPEYLGFVLEFLMMSDETVMGFCENFAHPTDIVQLARMALPGGDNPNWT